MANPSQNLSFFINALHTAHDVIHIPSSCRCQSDLHRVRTYVSESSNPVSKSSPELLAGWRHARTARSALPKDSAHKSAYWRHYRDEWLILRVTRLQTHRGRENSSRCPPAGWRLFPLKQCGRQGLPQPTHLLQA